jgi:pyridinium-3,5-biscarboxylic acid mononucleotide sulfurtransferase
MSELELKVKTLEKNLAALKSVVVAFSGGVDSAFLLFKALQTLGKDKVLAVTVHSQLHPASGADRAEKLARTMGAKHLIMSLDLLAEPAVAANTSDRCYHCKKTIYCKLLELTEKRGFAVLLDGTNADDRADHRPGFRALQELAVPSPLLEAGLYKNEIRELSRQAGLVTWNRPAEACLASRVPYGQKIDSSALRQVEEAELFLRDLGYEGDLRVRRHGNLARIEIKRTDYERLLGDREAVLSKFKQLGFLYITLDLDGFISGSMNRPLRLDQ